MKESPSAVKLALTLFFALACAWAQPGIAPEKEAAMKADALRQIDAMQKQAQVMVDTVFSFGELGFQEFETSRYLTAILEKEGFKIERGVAGIPTAWLATWGEGKPIISLGSDIDDLPQTSQKPGVAWHEPLVEGAPGHGEGHNSGYRSISWPHWPQSGSWSASTSRAPSSSGLASPRNSLPARLTWCGPGFSRTWTSVCSPTSRTT